MIFTYDKEDNKLYENRIHEGKGGDAFVYNSIYRLTGIKYGVPNLDPATDYTDYTTYTNKENFELDGVGNRISVANGTTTNYQVNQLNQYTAINGIPLIYDKNGNLKDDGTKLYSYDYANRLIKVIRKANNAVLGEYKYDAMGRRIEKVALVENIPPGLLNAQEKIGVGNGKGQGKTNSKGTGNALEQIQKNIQKHIYYVTTRFYYDGARCIEERDTSDIVSAQYVYGNGIDEVLQRTDYNPVGNITNEYYFHENTLGSIYAVTNKDGVVVEKYQYTAYGKVTFLNASGEIISQSAIHNSYLYTGREYDQETGLYYYRARYYSAEMGRFLQRDPIGYMAGMDLGQAGQTTDFVRGYFAYLQGIVYGDSWVTIINRKDEVICLINHSRASGRSRAISRSSAS